MHQLASGWGRLHKLTSYSGLEFKIYKELKKLTSKKTSIFKKMGYRAKQKILNWGILNGWDVLKKCSTSLVIREMQIKMTLSFHFTALRWAKNKTQLTGDSGKNVKKEEHSSIPAGTASWKNHFGDQSGNSWVSWKWFYLKYRYTTMVHIYPKDSPIY